MCSLTHTGLTVPVHAFSHESQKLPPYLILDDANGISSTLILTGTSELPISFLTEHVFALEVLIKENLDLIGAVKQTSLFGTQDLITIIPENWLYCEADWEGYHKAMNLTGEDITSLFCNLFDKDFCPDWLDISSDLGAFSKTWLSGERSDIEILHAISLLHFRTKSPNVVEVSLLSKHLIGLIGLAWSTFKNNGSIHLRSNYGLGIDVHKIIQAVRTAHGIKKINNHSLADGRKLMLSHYVRDLFRNREKGAFISLVNKSRNGASLKSHCMNYLCSHGYEDPIYSGYGGVGVYGHGESIIFGFRQGKVTIEESILMSFYFPDSRSNPDEELDLDARYSNTYCYKEKELWDLIYSTFSPSLFS